MSLVSTKQSGVGNSGRLSSTARHGKRMSMIPTLSLSKTEQTKDPKKFARLSFSEEFQEKMHDQKSIEIEIDLYTGVSIPYKTTIGETILSIIKYCEATYDLQKNSIVMVYKENFLLPCLSLSDVPDLISDKHPVIQALKDSHL
ncbi:hypothetical protein EIN_468340 [Entamoeba invadens IP1]|uniref:Uncharacterized protein n=1 Tax=Entamoeba invadens IP1 TaxID=370355 RepID=A0A0A1TUI5_ENTIV|nr:hypothetical protein EIN_468340 [Entamoeba invadens IP1]ELP83700.1 hypothetical protein EIN_468340 [Entamoeba invadens IP1]|eukprot:XP_004183046.1 hypothetical protein EIN_468340 [Entamoeba invadens IP1]